MRVLCPVVLPFSCAMLHASENLLLGSTITSEFVRDQRTRNVALLLEQLTEELLGHLLIAPVLEQDIEHVPVLINRPKQVVSPAADREEDLVDVPRVSGPMALLAGSG